MVDDILEKNGLTLNIDILRLFPEKSWCQVRCNHCRCSVRKGVLRNFVKFTGKHLCQSLFFNKVAGLPATLLKKRLWHSCFLENFTKFLRTPFLREYLKDDCFWLRTILIYQPFFQRYKIQQKPFYNYLK